MWLIHNANQTVLLEVPMEFARYDMPSRSRRLNQIILIKQTRPLIFITVTVNPVTASWPTDYRVGQHCCTHIATPENPIDMPNRIAYDTVRLPSHHAITNDYILMSRIWSTEGTGSAALPSLTLFDFSYINFMTACMICTNFLFYSNGRISYRIFLRCVRRGRFTLRRLRNSQCDSHCANRSANRSANRRANRSM